MRICRLLIIFIAVVGATLTGVAQSKLRIENADENRRQTDPSGQSVDRLTGNVRFVHEGTVMLCNEAYSYDQKQITATGNVRVIRDGVTLYGEQLVYDAGTRLGVVTGREVKLVDDSTVLVTDAIKFDTKIGSAEYSTGGTINSVDGDLVSQFGYYYKAQKKAVFKGNVVLNSNENVIRTDSLMYLLGTNMAVFIAPTDVVTPKEHMKFNRGKYNRKTGLMTASGSVYMVDERNREVLADSIEYYKEKGWARLFNNVQIADSARKSFILGDYALFNRSPEQMVVTNDPAMVSISKNGDSLYLRADTLKSLITIGAKGDTIRSMIGYKNVRSYSKDFQACCDSMFVSGVDSTVTMYQEPVLWSDISQITANEIKFISKNQQLVKADFVGEPFIAQRVDSSHFNQIKGKTMAAYFINNKIDRLDAIGNGQTVYFMQDSTEIIAVNITQSQNFTMYFEESKIKRITFREKPDSRMVPLDKLSKEESKGELKGLKWQGSRRPNSKTDVTYRTIRMLGEVPKPDGALPKSQPKAIPVKDKKLKKNKEAKPSKERATLIQAR